MAWYSTPAYATAETPDYKPPKPEKQAILNAWELARRYYSQLKTQQQRNHDYYQLKVKIATPSGYDAVLPPTARNLVNDAADHIASSGPDFTVPRPGQTEKQERRAEKIAKWCRAAWDRLNENQSQVLHRIGTVHQLYAGMLAYHLRYLPERYPAPLKKGASKEDQDRYDQRKRMAFPFEVKAIDPRSVYPDPGTNGETWVIQHFQRNVGMVQQQYPEWTGWRDEHGEPRDINENVEWIYYCDRHWRAYLADGEFVTPFKTAEAPGPYPHGLGFVPWVIRSAGLSDDSGPPDEKYQSIIYMVEGLLDEEMRAWSQIQAIIRDTAWPWMITPIGAKVDPGARKISEVPPDLIDKIKQMRPDSDTPKALVEYIQMVEGKLEASTYSQVVTGHAPSGQRSGYSIAVLAGMARVKFGPILENQESALAELMKKILLTVENKIGEKVQIWLGGADEFEIGPSDLQGYERVDCQIKAKLVQDRAADADIGLRLYSTGALSAETMLKEYAHIPEPLEEHDRRIAEDFLKFPPIQMQIMIDMAKRRGLSQDLLQTFMAGTGMQPNGQSMGKGNSSPGGTPATPAGMAGSEVPGAPPPPGRPSIPGPGPTSPLGPGAGNESALTELSRLPGQLKRAGQLGGDIPLG